MREDPASGSDVSASSQSEDEADSHSECQLEQVLNGTLNAVTTDNDGMGLCMGKVYRHKGRSEGAARHRAGISPLPKRLHDVISKSQDSELWESYTTITGANRKTIECFGVAEIDLNIEGQAFKHDFYVCANVVTVLLSRQFMKDMKI